MSLDDDLAAWAATIRLTDADADAIFNQIVPPAVGPARPQATPTAPQLDPKWWRSYNAGFAARMVASTAPVRLAA